MTMAGELCDRGCIPTGKWEGRESVRINYILGDNDNENLEKKSQNM